MKPALVIVDMLKDTFEKHPDIYISKRAMEFVPVINELSEFFRNKNFPVVYSCDAFSPDDFFFQGREPHSIKGTKGAEVIDALVQKSGDIILEKPRFSSFFKTDFEKTLKDINVDTVVVAGITTQVCVLATVIDAVSSDFNTILLEDCCAASKPEIHDAVVNIFKRTALYPLLRIISSSELIREIEA